MSHTVPTTPSPISAERSGRAEQLRRLVVEAVAATAAEGILLSGGLDTSIVATLAAAQGRRLHAVTVSVADSSAPDEPFAKLVAARLGFELQVLCPQLQDLIDRMSEVVRLLDTFDPMELRNSIVTYLGLEAAHTAGIGSVLTGDAADELFAGYSFMFNMQAEQLSGYVRYLNEVMHFTSLKLGPALGVRVELPYLNSAVRAFALTLDAADLVGEREGRRFGKRILREAFADMLPEEIVWRAKTPIEFGSGSTALTRMSVEAVSDEEFECARERVAREDGVRLRDKEQYFYYRLYRQVFPPPREQPRGPKTCPQCQGPVPRLDMRYCRICGAYPV